MGFFGKLFGRPKVPEPEARLGMADLSRLLGVDAAMLAVVPVNYQSFTLPKRSGGTREILAPSPELKNLQRLILRRVLRSLPAHDAAHGFERHRSIVTNARVHVGSAVVLRLDLQNFFPTTRGDRVKAFFRGIGWSEQAAAALCRICVYKDALPQGAPTSPRLSNLVNIKLDARLAALAVAHQAAYTRYADDLTFSFLPPAEDWHFPVNRLIHHVKLVVSEAGYRLHTEKKLRIHRSHDRQQVTGLVVNEVVQLPRETRRRLRAIEHRLSNGKPATLSPIQLKGWQSLRAMIVTQRQLP